MSFVKLVARLFADTSEFEKGLKSASRKSREFREGVVRVFSRAATYVAGLGGAFAFLVGKQSLAGDEIGKISQKYGVAAESLSSLDHAANLAGVSTEDLAKSFKFMNSALVSAAGGSKEQIAAFAAMGLSYKDLLNLKPEDAFTRISEAISKIESPALKSALAVKVFGKSGADLIPLFNMSAEALEKSKEEARRFGLEISNVDASNLEAMNDSLEKVSSASAGAARQFAIGLAPSVSKVVEGFLAGVDSANLFRSAGEAVGETFSFVIKHIQGLANAVHGTANAVLAGIWQLVRAIAYPIQVTINKVMDGLEAISGKKFDRMNFVDDIDAIIKDQLSKSENNIRQAADNYKQSFESLVDVFNDAEIKAPDLKNISKPFDLEKVLEDAKKTSEALDNYKKKVEDAQKAQQDWNNATADSFIAIKDAMMQGGKMADNFKRMALSAINEVANSLIKMAFNAENKGSGGLFGGIASGLGGLFKSGFSGLGKWFSGLLPSFDVGSNYIPRDMTANIHKGEMIIPAREAAQIRSGGLGGGSVIQNVTIGAGVTTAVRQEVARMLPELKKATIDAVKDSRMRGNNV
jgi:hypothetical protein